MPFLLLGASMEGKKAFDIVTVFADNNNNKSCCVHIPIDGAQLWDGPESQSN